VESRYWSDRHSKFHLYDEPSSTPSIQDLLEADPTNIFWG
jgi:Protein of unknown function (DUF3024)